MKQHLVEEAQPNFDQFLLLHPECNAPITEHDRRFESLSAACFGLETALVECRALQQALDRVISALPAEEVSQYFGAADAADYLKVIAEYIINGTQRLPSYYTTAPIWNKHREEFLAVRETAEVSPFWREAVRMAGTFSAAIQELTNKLKTLRYQRSLSAGVPIVDRLSG